MTAFRFQFLLFLSCVCFAPKDCHARFLASRASVVLLRGGSEPKFGYGIRTPASQQKNKNWQQWSSQQQQQNNLKPTTQTDDSDDEKLSGKEVLNAFLTRDSRNTFIARVYGILAGQLLATALSCVLFGTQPALRHFVAGAGRIVPVISLLLSAVAWGIMCTSVDARRKSPQKWWLLGAFTLGEAISVGFISSFYVFKSVVSALVATAISSLSVSLYVGLNRKRKYDLTQLGSGLASCLMIFFVYSIIGLLQQFGVIPANFLPYNEAVMSAIGCCLFSAFLAYHTRLIVAGKHSKYQMNEKDYVFGAMTLYNDIINIFIYILRIMGEDRDR